MRTFPAAALAAISALVTPFAAFGADGPLPEAVVTATRTPLAPEDVAVPVIVITREDIERSLAADIGELLQGRAGIEIARTGGPGQTATLFLRGTESDHTLVLVDGVRINPGTIGGAAIQNISPESVERIEIVKGPRSTLYGSDAIGGVVNVFTRAGARQGIATTASFGRYGTWSAQGEAGLPLGERAALGLNLGYSESEGFPARRGGTDDHGYDNLTANLFGEFTATEALKFRARAWRAQGTSEYADFFMTPVDQDYETGTAALEAEFETRPGRRLRIGLSHGEDDIRQNQSQDFVRTRRDTLDVQADLRVAGVHALTAGALLAREATDALSYGAGFDVDTDTDQFYLQDRLSVGAHDLALVAGYTDHETFGGETTWNAEYAVSLPSRTRLSIAAGRAFHAPSSTDRFGYGGNPALEPEASRQVELGVRQRLGVHHEIFLSAYENRIEDLINFRLVDPVTFELRAENVEEARIRGVEAGYAFRGERWRLRAEASIQNPRNLTTGERLLRRARESLVFEIVRSAGRLDLGLDVLASGARKDWGFPVAVELDGYALVDLSARFAVSERFALQARLDNALDKRYELASGYNTPRRSYVVAMRWRIR